MQCLNKDDWAVYPVHMHGACPADLLHGACPADLLRQRAMSNSRHLGKIRKRLEDIKSQSSKLTKADFSHNESIRLATDAFLDGGRDSYLETLHKEGEVDFLSSVEVQYIKDNARESYYAEESLATDGAAAPKQNYAGSLPSGTYFPTISDSSEPALLHTWITADKPYLKEKSTATVYFQTEKNNNIRDIIRRYINKTTQVLAIVMDVFTDTEIFCDLLEAANKRMVFVYLLLDYGSINLFSEMCDKLQVSEDLFKNISVRSVTGEVYCAKSGRKFSGQIREKFLISDWKYVLSGSYSFTWLCGQVHRNLLSKFTGQVVELFDEEFRHLYALSKPVRGPNSPPRTMPFLFNRSWAPQHSLPCSNEENANTLSDTFSSLSTGSTHQNKQNPTALVFSSNLAPQSPLHRVNSFHNYVSFTPSPPQKAIQGNYYQPPYVADNSAVLYNNMNVYRPIRLRQEEPNRTGLNSPWRCLHQANLFT